MCIVFYIESSINVFFFKWLLLISVDLSTALTSESLAGVLNDPDTLQQLQNHLPAVDQNTQEALRSTLASPQFQQVSETKEFEF